MAADRQPRDEVVRTDGGDAWGAYFLFKGMEVLVEQMTHGLQNGKRTVVRVMNAYSLREDQYLAPCMMGSSWIQSSDG